MTKQTTTVLRSVGSSEPEQPTTASTTSAIGITPPSRRAAGRRSVPEILVELGLVSRDQLKAAIDTGREADKVGSGRPLEEILVETGSVTSEQLAKAIAERFSLDYVDLTAYRPDMAAVNLVSAHAARRYNAVPIGFDSYEVLLVAVADPSNVLALDDLKLLTGHEMRPVVAPPEDIAALIGKMNRLEQAVAEAIENDEDGEEVLSPIGEIRETADDAPVIKLVNSIIAQAVEEGASDIHFEPDTRDMRVRFRVDGVLSETATIPRRMVPGVVSRIKIMGELDIAERRIPQDGRLTRKIEDRRVDIRIVTLPSALGEGIVMRLLDKEQVLLTLDHLGIMESDLRKFEAAFSQSYGAVLVTGPTGSGKSTTLYSALNVINSVEKNIITIEDPVEYQLPGITQIGVNGRAGLTFARGLRSMLRADPDIIMVGEIRDSETARIAIESALTGHLVLTTLHTNDAASAITRLTEMGIEPFMTASAVDCILAQRLARTLCSYCKRPVTVAAEALRAAGFDVEEDVSVFEPVGCARCKHTGHKGRTGIFEAMPLTEEIRTLALERASADTIRDRALEQGMRGLRQDGLEKIRLGMTSIAEVARVT